MKGDLKKKRESYPEPKVPYARYQKRLYYGWDEQRAISENVGLKVGGSRKGKYIGKRQEVWNEIQEDVHPSLTKQIVGNRLWNGWSYKQAISLPKGTYRDRY